MLRNCSIRTKQKYAAGDKVYGFQCNGTITLKAVMNIAY